MRWIDSSRWIDWLGLEAKKMVPSKMKVGLVTALQDGNKQLLGKPRDGTPENWEKLSAQQTLATNTENPVSFAQHRVREASLPDCEGIGHSLPRSRCRRWLGIC